MPFDDLAEFQPTGGCFGGQVRYYAEAGSTNEVALAAGRQGAPEGLVIVVDVQTAGRGRMGRRWEAPPGTSLLLSVLFRPPQPFPFYAVRTTMVCGLALRDAVLHEAGVPVQLKWPNDLITADTGARWSKLAGILSEIGLTSDGTPETLVVGIGVNVNVPHEALAALGPNAGSLLAERGAPVARTALLRRLLAYIELHFQALRHGVDPLAAWRDALAWMGEEVEVRGPSEVIVGVATGVADDGGLLVGLADGEISHVTAGDVSLRLRSAV